MAQIAIDRPLPSSLNGFVCCTPSLWAWDKCGSVKARGNGFKITVQLAAQRAAFEACVAHCERAPRAAAQCRPRSVGSRRRRRFWCIGRPSEARTLPRFCTPTGCQAQLNSRQHTVCCDMCPDAVWIRVVQVLSLPALGRSRRCPTWRERAHTHSRAVGAPRCRSRFRRQRSAGLAIFSHDWCSAASITHSIHTAHTYLQLGTLSAQTERSSLRVRTAHFHHKTTLSVAVTGPLLSRHGRCRSATGVDTILIGWGA